MSSMHLYIIDIPNTIKGVTQINY